MRASAEPQIQWHATVPIGVAIRRNTGRGPDTVSVYWRAPAGPIPIRTDTLWLGSEAARYEFLDAVSLEIAPEASIADQYVALDKLLEAAAHVGGSQDDVKVVGRSQVITLSDVEAEPVRWLWPGRLPYGKLTVLEGDPGLGKSQLTLALAAAVTTGGRLPGGAPSDASAGEPGDVLLLTGEDGLADTVKPRLQAASGDSARVHVLQGVPDPERPGQFRFPSLPEDATHLQLEIRERRGRLVIVDTLTTYLGGDYNSFKDADVRRALAPLAHVAETTGCAIVLVRHLTKQSRGRAITAGGGSIGIVGGARSCLLLAEDPDNPDLRVLAVVKANLTKKPDSLSLTIEEAANGWPHVVWSGTSAHSADDLIAARGEEDHGEREKLEDARDRLRRWLADGPALVDDVERLADEAGIKRRTLRRAKDRERVQAFKQGFRPSRWFWKLPDLDGQSPPKPAPKMAISPITPTDGHLRENQSGKLLSPQDAGEDGHSMPAVAMFGGGRPHCPLHPKVPFRRRRRGSTGCWICFPPNPKNPCVEPVPRPGDAEYEAYRGEVAA